MTTPTSAQLVKKNTFAMPSYTTVGGKTIKDVKVGWESYGELNDRKDNVILVPHSFSSNSHAAGKYDHSDEAPGYWDSIIGPGKAVDTNKFFVISIDSLVNLNSKDGVTVTTGPASINPDTGKPYGLTFPIVTIPDFVRVQKALMDALGIKKLHASVGMSMGALQSYEWAAAFPEMVERVIALDGAPTQTPFRIAELECWSAAIKVDANWNNGDYYGGPEPVAGVALSFFNILVSVRHPEFAALHFGYKWGDQKKDPMHALDHEFLSEKAFKDIGLMRATATTDANTMLYMTKANQLFIAGTPGSSVDAELKKIKAKTLVLQARTDMLFTPQEAQGHAAKLKENGTDVRYVEFDSPDGHLASVSGILKVADLINDFIAA